RAVRLPGRAVLRARFARAGAGVLCDEAGDRAACDAHGARSGVNILALDQGTSATKALLVGPGGEVLGRGEATRGTRSVGDAGVEADPAELLQSVLAAGRAALSAARAPAEAVALAI